MFFVLWMKMMESPPKSFECFTSQPRQNNAFSNQNRGHLGSRNLYFGRASPKQNSVCQLEVEEAEQYMMISIFGGGQNPLRFGKLT